MVSLMCGWMGSSLVVCEKCNQVCILIWNAFIENNSMFTAAAFALKQSSTNGWLPKLTASNRKMLQMFQIKKNQEKTELYIKPLILSWGTCISRQWCLVFHICQWQTWGRVAYVSACLSKMWYVYVRIVGNKNSYLTMVGIWLVFPFHWQ